MSLRWCRLSLRFTFHFSGDFSAQQLDVPMQLFASNEQLIQKTESNTFLQAQLNRRP